MKFHHDKANTLNWLSGFYLECGYGGEFDSSDDVYYVSKNGTIVGVVRIAYEYGFYILRGMQVLPLMRGNQIGRELLEYLEDHLSKYSNSCFCLPHEHLNTFYGAIGFKPLSDCFAPEFIRVRKEQYSERGLKISLLYREQTL